MLSSSKVFLAPSFFRERENRERNKIGEIFCYMWNGKKGSKRRGLYGVWGLGDTQWAALMDLTVTGPRPRKNVNGPHDVIQIGLYAGLTAYLPGQPLSIGSKIKGEKKKKN